MSTRTARQWILLIAFVPGYLMPGCMGHRAHAQAPLQRPSEQQWATATEADLPNAPDTLLDLQPEQPFATPPAAPAQPQPARKYHRVVRPYEYAEPLSAAGKLKLSVMSRLTLGEAGATVFAAGFSQVRNSRPHYGTDSGAFGERLGALAIKQTSQSILSYGVFAAAFHDDPRYYVMGRSKPIVRRAVYAATRLVLARKDDGSSAINWPMFAGIASATALTNAYYPQVDRGFGQGAKAFGTSLGTSILNNEMHEFIGDAIRLIRHKH